MAISALGPRCDGWRRAVLSTGESASVVFLFGDGIRTAACGWCQKLLGSRRCSVCVAVGVAVAVVVAVVVVVAVCGVLRMSDAAWAMIIWGF